MANWLIRQGVRRPPDWVGIEDRLRERPRMSPWVEERALAFAIHVIRGFSENTSTGCLGASKEFVDLRDTKCDGVRRGALLRRRSGIRVYAGFGHDDGPVACARADTEVSELRRRTVNGRAVVSHSTASRTSGWSRPRASRRCLVPSGSSSACVSEVTSASLVV